MRVSFSSWVRLRPISSDIASSAVSLICLMLKELMMKILKSNIYLGKASLNCLSFSKRVISTIKSFNPSSVSLVQLFKEIIFKDA